MSPDQSVLSETKVRLCVCVAMVLISPFQQETIPLLPVKHDSSAIVSQPTTEPVLQSSDELKVSLHIKMISRVHNRKREESITLVYHPCAKFNKVSH